MLSKEKADKLIFGGIYTANPADLECLEKVNDNSPWDQRYKYWVPIRVFDKNNDRYNYYMVNCYQIDSYCWSRDQAKRYEDIVRKYTVDFYEDGSDALYKTWNYFYRSCTLLNDYNICCFTLVADLHDYQYISNRESEDYLDEDLLKYTKLFREHAYPNGITLVRKGAEKNTANRIDALIKEAMNSSSAPSAFAPDIKKLTDMISEAEETNQQFNVKKARAVVIYLEELIDLQKRFEPIRQQYFEACLED